ncbi:transcription termination factor 4, mitochondrial isoform X2 [Bufo gargarizans]|uniref:transcription termination factor 4, mitochondrial isoform X2 n=1 Tax=Bufo gargarizans TaxID=30331 RepID=UPI001CF484C1|nr:transcription termination factor 4, mitochondrial isoform X2 [Bufo gargarizans]
MVSLSLRHIIAFSRSSLCLRSMSSIPNARQALLDLGFSDEQAEKIQRLRCPPHKMPNIKELFFIGLSHRTVLRILEERPELLKITDQELRDRVDTLRSLGLGEGSLQNSLSRCSALLLVPRSRLLAATQCLKMKCQFTSQQVLKILNTAPETLTQDPRYLEDVFQYIYFRMGGNQGEMISSQVFQVSLNEIRVRHQFLERLGKFYPPNKKRVCPTSNPKLKEVIQLAEEDFLSHTAHSTLEEFNTFRKILEREEHEAEQQMEDTEDELSSDEDDDEQDSDSEDDSADEDHEENADSEKPNLKKK